MARNDFGIDSTTSLFYGEDTSLDTQDEMTIIFDRIFGSDEDIVELNMMIILFLSKLINKQDFTALNRFLGDDALKDFKPSLLKSTLLVTKNIPNIQESRSKVVDLLEQKRQNY